MIIQCPDCGARYKLHPAAGQKASTRVKCPKCRSVFQVVLSGRQTGGGPPAEGKRPAQPPVGKAVPPKPSSTSKSSAALRTVAPPKPSSVPRSSSGPKPSSTILVVDDSQFFRELIVDVLKPIPASVLTAADGEEAMALIRREHPALVILDLNLQPGKNGYDLIRDIRADLALSDIRLLAMSGVFRKKTDVAEVEMAGADDFISKSFTPEQLQSRVSELLRS